VEIDNLMGSQLAKAELESPCDLSQAFCGRRQPASAGLEVSVELERVSHWERCQSEGTAKASRPTSQKAGMKQGRPA